MNDSITVISSKRKIFNLNLKELWKYRDLIFLFVKRDFVSKYKQTVLGPLWAIIQPLFTTLVFTVIFGNLAKLTTMDSINQEGLVIPSFLFYMCGNICWAYFSGCLNSCGNTFIGNADLTLGYIDTVETLVYWERYIFHDWLCQYQLFFHS